MVLLIFVAPTVVVLAVLPAVSDLSKRRTAALAFVAVYTGLVTILQVQGTVRACVTFAASAKARVATETAAASVIQRWFRFHRRRISPEDRAVTKAVWDGVLPRYATYSATRLLWTCAHPDADASTDAAIDIGADLPTVTLFSPPKFTAPDLPTWHRNFGVYVTFALEALQLSLFSFQFLLVAPDSPFDLGSLPGVAVWLPYSYFSFPDPSLARLWAAFALVAAVALVVAARVLQEVYRTRRGGRRGAMRRPRAISSTASSGPCCTATETRRRCRPRCAPSCSCCATRSSSRWWAPSAPQWVASVTAKR
jgi:hypothetical protein